MAKTRLTDIFRHVGRLDLDFEFLRELRRLGSSRRTGQWLFPFRHRRLDTRYQHLRASAAANRHVRSVSTRADQNVRFEPRRAAARSGSPSGVQGARVGSRYRPGASLRDAIAQYRGTRGDSAECIATAGRAAAGGLITGPKFGLASPGGSSISYHTALEYPDTLRDPSADADPESDVVTCGEGGDGDGLPSTVWKRVIDTLRSHELLNEQRLLTANLERGLVNVERETRDSQAALNGLIGSRERDARATRCVRRNAKQAQEALTLHHTALDVARESLILGESRLAETQRQIVLDIERMSGPARLGGIATATSALRDTLFATPNLDSESMPDDRLTHARTGPQKKRKRSREADQQQSKRPRLGSDRRTSDQGPRSGRFAALPAAVRPILERGGDLRANLVEARQALVDQYLGSVEAFDYHRNQHGEMLERHLDGADTDLPQWTPAWTREEFETAHLREWIRSSTAVRVSWQDMTKMLKLVGKAGIEPLDWQESGFWQPGTLGYPASMEDDMIAGAPLAEIYDWADDLPLNARGLVGRPDALPDSAYNPAGYGGEHAVAWPADDQVYEPAPEVLPGDSFSCAALEYDKERNHQWAGPRNTDWTVSKIASEREAIGGMQPMSHFF